MSESINPFHIISHNARFTETIFKYKYAFWIPVQILSVKVLILRRTERVILLNLQIGLCNLPVTFENFSRLNFSTVVGKVSNIIFSTNQEPTDAMTNLVATFLEFAKARNIFHFATHLKYSNPRTYLQAKWMCGAA